jgi:hypothetical protein
MICIYLEGDMCIKARNKFGQESKSITILKDDNIESKIGDINLVIFDRSVGPQRFNSYELHSGELVDILSFLSTKISKFTASYLGNENRELGDV